MYECEHRIEDFRPAFRNGHYAEDSTYECALDGEGCSLYYDGFCIKGDD